MWRSAWRGDLDPFGFVDPRLHGGFRSRHEGSGVFATRSAHAAGTQGAAGEACTWPQGAVAHPPPDIRRAGRPPCGTDRRADVPTTCWKWSTRRGFALPSKIYNLRIAGVGTVASDAEFVLEQPYRTSRLWLGVSLFGTGDFKTRQERRVDWPPHDRVGERDEISSACQGTAARPPRAGRDHPVGPGGHLPDRDPLASRGHRSVPWRTRRTTGPR